MTKQNIYIFEKFKNNITKTNITNQLFKKFDILFYFREIIFSEKNNKKQASRTQGDALDGQKRQCEVVFLNAAVVVDVESFADEVMVRFDAWVKSQAICGGVLKPYPWEDMFTKSVDYVNVRADVVSSSIKVLF